MTDGIADQQLFDSGVWTEPLAKFAQATGLTISLYDANFIRRCEVTSSPIGDRLRRAGFWEKDGTGAQLDVQAAKLSTLQMKMVYTVQLEMFAHLAIPLVADQRVLATLVMGWLPEKFADPVLCDRLSKQIAAPPMEIWQLMRMQQPISSQKLESHARMLETFALPLIRQLLVQVEDRRREQRAKVISEAAWAFAEATTEPELCDAVLSSIQRLIPSSSIKIEILKLKNEHEETIDYARNAIEDSASFNGRHLTLFIPTSQGHRLGRVKLTYGESELSEEQLQDFHLIIAQFGTALQKVHLIQTLESERSALKGANLQLQHLHKMKDEFLATVSHELRTPLNAILGWAELLREEGAQKMDFEIGMETIERNAKNQSNLIEDLLDVSRIISGKMVLHRDDIEATSLLRQSIATVMPMIEARKQKLHLQISPVALHMKGDSTRITQVFWNLLSNASKFTPSGGDISVILESAGHYLRLEVSDSGKGIAPEFLPHLFDRFSQADSSNTRRHGGLGLGLAIVRHLVDLHGGTVMAASDGENKGSKFSVFIPQRATTQELDSAQSLTQFIASRPLRPTLSLDGVKILLVDDEPDSLRLTRFVLEKSGAMVEITDNAEEAFQKLREWHPDLLISDISMPDESGYELIRRVRYLSHEEGGRTLAVALTALAGREQRELALEAGFQLHMTKPIEPNQLASGVVNLLKKSRIESGLH